MSPIFLSKVIRWLSVLVILKIVGFVFWSYGDYFPPNFQADFLLGREIYFYEGYHWGFYIHILFGPLSLLLGLVLISQNIRRRYPLWHRRLGRVQGVIVLLLVVPSGIGMSLKSAGSWPAGLAFATLGIVTAICTIEGWRQAVNRKFAAHRRWMWRTFVLLCSAVVLRVIGGLGHYFELDADWLYPINSWVSWLLPLAVCETALRRESK